MYLLLKALERGVEAVCYEAGDPVYGVYKLVLEIAMGGLGLFLAFSVV